MKFLFDAIINDDIYTINSFLENHPTEEIRTITSPNVPDPATEEYLERTLLHAAVVYNRLDILKRLVAHIKTIDPLTPAPLNGVVDENGRTILFDAIYQGQVTMVEYLLQQKLDPHAVDNFKEIPLFGIYKLSEQARAIVKNNESCFEENSIEFEDRMRIIHLLGQSAANFNFSPDQSNKYAALEIFATFDYNNSENMSEVEDLFDHFSTSDQAPMSQDRAMAQIVQLLSEYGTRFDIKGTCGDTAGITTPSEEAAALGFRQTEKALNIAIRKEAEKNSLRLFAEEEPNRKKMRQSTHDEDETSSNGYSSY